MERNTTLRLPKIKQNISSFERLASTLGGFYLLYDALKHKRHYAEIGAAGFMVARGISGYCPFADAFTRITYRERHDKSSNVNIHARMIVKKELREVYNFWRHLGNLPLFMDHLESVAVLSDVYSEWKANLPGHIGSVSWKAQIVGEEPYKYIGWRSLPGSAIHNSGKVEFKDAGELGTLVHVVFSYQAPLGATGEGIARLVNPLFEKTVRKDILGFKRFMETGTPEKISQETVRIYD